MTEPNQHTAWKPRRSLWRLLWLTTYTAVMYLLIKISGKLKA
jgi:hypothetical protein